MIVYFFFQITLTVLKAAAGRELSAQKGEVVSARRDTCSSRHTCPLMIRTAALASISYLKDKWSFILLFFFFSHAHINI